MKMQITVENLTTTKALAILSALETAEALHDTELGINVLPLNERDVVQAEKLAAALATDANWDEVPTDDADESHFRTTSVDAADRRRLLNKRSGLPLLGLRNRQRLLPVYMVSIMLGLGQNRLDYLARNGAIETVGVPHGSHTYRYMTPEQVEVLRFALHLREGNHKRLSRAFLRRATEQWLASHSEITDSQRSA